ncbi:MAG TPA: phosphatase PAP2 family protein [Candidatus Pacearchaeota archaeon]|nr:phosphatase PAP2 family protein [Candidatus Pacearchaeota archaeon]
MAVKRGKKLILFAIAFVLIIFLATLIDNQFIQLVYSLRNSFLTNSFLGFTIISSEIVSFLFLTILFLWQRKTRKWVAPLWFSFSLSVIASFILKITVQRLRPFQQDLIYLLPALESSNFLTWNFSFPSFQTMFAFCAIPILNKNFPRFKYFWIAFALLVGFSRIYLGLHFLSDVLAGAFLGLAIGEIIVLIEQKNSFWEKSYKKIFKK